MRVVELFLPLRRGNGSEVEKPEIDLIISLLTERFGGATAFTRSPASGLWKGAGEVERDEIVIVEVLVDQLDRQWWRAFKEQLEDQFRQKQILIRVSECEIL